MKSTYYLFLCLCIPLFALTSCENDLEGDNFGQDTERYDIPLTSKSAEVNAKVQKFSFDFYREMARRQKADFCISPLSVNLCLGMVLNGADGNTYKEIQETLGYENFTYEEINAYAQMMQTELPKLDGRTIFTMPIACGLGTTLRCWNLLLRPIRCIITQRFTMSRLMMGRRIK